MDAEKLFYDLLRAEVEDELSEILARHGLGLDDATLWRPLGDIENHFGLVGNQQSSATAALVEKLINGVDALLIAACLREGIDPESQAAPRSMAEAAERFFRVRNGRLEYLDASERTELADNLHLVAVGEKTRPCYLIVDKGEGQTPLIFPDTFLSLAKSNKIRIPFVQGKYNAGGTGVLQFCGKENYQLIVSRRQPGLRIIPGDRTWKDWGITLVRRLRPQVGSGRKNSMYVYLAPGGKVLSFSARSVNVLPRFTKAGAPPKPYEEALEWGTCIKLYEYEWRAKSIATTESRYELERFLHTLCLPIRVTEARNYQAHYFSTTVSGSSVTIEDDREQRSFTEAGFPADSGLNIPDVGKLQVWIVVYKPTEDGAKRRNPYGVCFTVNGQVHGQMPPDFISRRLGFGYLARDLLVSVDCTGMRPDVREDFFMASRDRLRDCDAYDKIEEELVARLREHPGLREMNQRRREQQVKQSTTDDEPSRILQQLVHADPTLTQLLVPGSKIKKPFGPDKPESPYVGKRFPTYFKIASEPKGGLVKDCPVNLKCRVEFETDAENDYFSRGESPGKFTCSPDCGAPGNLWNGNMTAMFHVPQDAKIGETMSVRVEVTDDTRVSPFVCDFKIRIQARLERVPPPPGPPRRPKGGSEMGMPPITEVFRDCWVDHNFDDHSGLEIVPNGDGSFDVFVNMDNIFLLGELKREADPGNQGLIRYWFKYGLYLTALGLIYDNRRREESRSRRGEDENEADDQKVDYFRLAGKVSCGIAAVIVPVIRRLAEGPKVAA